MSNSEYELTDTTLIDSYLSDQRDLSAVEQFSRFHDSNGEHEQRKYYKNLIPFDKPSPGEQYAFEVDLDQCTGCKACITGCHSANGLDEDETWRSVGTVYGGTEESPVLQMVTTACHHCANPECMNGCPTQAYEKDPITGIVKHLDDQCFGCQYCTIKCPYGVPQYNKKRGIVRKCDMCSTRLEAGEAPACVQSCPNGAIKITFVKTKEAWEQAQQTSLIPGAPDPRITVPTTRYKSKKRFPKNSLPIDHYNVKPENPHLSLVFMLVLTQLSVGSFCAGLLFNSLISHDIQVVFKPYHTLFSLALGITALVASTFHLGRPLYAYRAFIGLKTSWLSREIISFGIFAFIATLYALSYWVDAVGFFMPSVMIDILKNQLTRTMLGSLVVVSGLVGILCSVMIYKVTPRIMWSGNGTFVKFYATAAMMGVVTLIIMSLISVFSIGDSVTMFYIMQNTMPLFLVLLVIASCKLCLELVPFIYLRDSSFSLMKRSALLMKGELRRPTVFRFVFGIFGGVLIPLFVITFYHELSMTTLFGLSLAVFILIGIGELLERYLFFTSVIAPKMPGGSIV